MPCPPRGRVGPPQAGTAIFKEHNSVRGLIQEGVAVEGESVGLDLTGERAVAVDRNRAGRCDDVAIEGDVAVEGQAAGGDVEGEPSGMRGATDVAVEGYPIGKSKHHGSDDLQGAAPVEREVLQVVDRGGRCAVHAEDEAAGAVGGQVAIGACGYGARGCVAVEGEVAQRVEVAGGIGGRIERDIAGAGGRRRCADGGERDRVRAAHEIAQYGVAVERDRGGCRGGTA